MKTFAFLLMVGLFACSPRADKNDQEHSNVDSINLVQKVAEPPLALMETGDLYQQLDSICLHAAVQAQVEGDYLSSYLVTENFLVINSREQPEERIVVVCMRTGLHPSEDQRDNAYLTEYAYLIALQRMDNAWALREVLKIGESGSDGLVKRSVRADPVFLGPDAEAILVTLQYSELSAGDYGTQMETGGIMAWSGESISGIFQITLEDYVYSSGEIASSTEDRTISTYSLLESDGWLNDIEVITKRSRNMMEEDLGIDELNETDTFVYQFNGKAYMPVFK